MKKMKSNFEVPQWALSFLEWFCPDNLVEGIAGDLLEQFEDDLTRFSIRKSRRRFIWNVLRLFHPSIILRNQFHFNYLSMGMMQSHLKVAFRSMKKYSFYSLVNILGLSLAIAFVFLCFRFIQTEHNYDQFHFNKQHVYRLYHRIVNSESGAVKDESAVTAIPLSSDLSEELAAIKAFTRIASDTKTIGVDGKAFEEKITYVDPGFFQLFDFPVIAGRAIGLEPNEVMLSAEQATRVFGQANPIDQLIRVSFNESEKNLKVVGIIDNEQQRSSIQFEVLTPIENFREVVGEETFNSYRYGMVENYILSNGSLSSEELSNVLSSAIQQKLPDEKIKSEIGLQALEQIHFEDQIVGNASFTSPRKLYILSGLALLVLLIALINFIILSTSHAVVRSKEIGIRSTLGARKHQLKRQMISESFFVVLFSSVLGIGMAYFATPHFAQLIDGTIPFFISWKELLLVLVLCMGIAWINGRLQALFLIKSNAVQSLRGMLSLNSKNSLLNKSLLVIQFSISIVLLIAAWGMRMQMHYIQNKDLGFDQQRLIEISLNGLPDIQSAQQLVDRFRTLAMQEETVLAVSASMNNAREPWTQLLFDQNDGRPEAIYYNQIDPAYLSTMNIQLLDGAKFRPDHGNAKNNILVNESLVKHFGWDDPFVQQLPGKNFSGEHQIIGVIKDFHFSSMYQKIEPLILALDVNAIRSGITGLSTYVWPSGLYQLLVRVGPGELPQIVQQLESIWKEVAPDNAFVYHFVDASLEAKYAEDRRWSKAINFATLFAIFIAWLGLLGLMRLTLQKRTKEIGIRKVLGASTEGIIGLLSKQYLLLILIGNLLAIPFAFWGMRQWLNHFSYRIELSPMLFIAAGFSIILLTFLSLGLQSIKAASTNPADTLKAS